MAGAPAATSDQEVTLRMGTLLRWQSKKTETPWVPDDRPATKVALNCQSFLSEIKHLS